MDEQGEQERAGRPCRRVLVVDDDDDVRALVRRVLEPEGFHVDEAASGRAALDRFAQADLVLLDLGLPDVDGFELLGRIRAATDVPVIVVTARADPAARVKGLDLGADDVVVKPFGVAELAARVRAALRRARPREARTRLAFPGLVIDLARRRVEVRGAPVTLRPKEFDLLAHLASEPGRVFTRDELLRGVWQSRLDWQNPKTVTEHIRRLRANIEDDPEQPRRIVTERAVGYRFQP